MSDGQSKSWQQLGDEFYLMMGQCIASWAQVDDALFRIFQACVGPPEQCAIIYYRQPGLDIRFGLTEEIVVSVLPKRERQSGGHDHPDVATWKDIVRTGKKLLETRRRIAHYPVMLHMVHIEPSRVGEPPPAWFEIYVNQHERMRGRQSDIKPIHINDLSVHLLLTMELQGRFNRFFFEILANYVEASPLQTSPLQPPQSP